VKFEESPTLTIESVRYFKILPAPYSMDIAGYFLKDKTDRK
jgi:hypothetical protein